MADSIIVEVAYLDADLPVVRSQTLPAGSVLADALRVLAQDWNAEPWIRGDFAVGVFGRVVALDFRLSQGDRIELYRPLLNDPKAARRLRAKMAAKRR